MIRDNEVPVCNDVESLQRGYCMPPQTMERNYGMVLGTFILGHMLQSGVKKCLDGIGEWINSNWPIDVN